jgi:hypothetical protein
MQHVKIISYEDAADATVSVEDGDGLDGFINRGLRVNGKTDATTRSDLNTQMLLGHLPLLARPDAKNVFVFGLGSGISAGALRAYPGVEKIVIAENCEPVVRASKFFNAENRNILADARTKLWHEDARTVLKLSAQNYDAIVAEPSNPWTAGIGSVFSREFYQLAASRLKPGGLMVQWFHLYEMHDGIVELVLRTFTSVFPNVEIWDAGAGDIVMLGSQQPWTSDPEIFAKSFSIPAVRADFEKLGVNSAAALFARQLASQRTAWAITGPGPMQSDFFPVLEYAAPRAVYLAENSKLLEKFDERTCQQLLAPARKTEILRYLSAAEVESVFSKFSSANGEMILALHSPTTFQTMPIIFNTNAPRASVLPPPDGEAAIAQQFIVALDGDVNQRRQGIASIEALLAARPPGTNANAAAWAALAATAALNLGDNRKSAQLAALAQQLNPDDAQAAFIFRLLLREAPGLFGHHVL